MPTLDQFVIANSATQNGESWDLVGASWDILPATGVPVQSSFVVLVSVILSREEALTDHVLAIRLTGPDGAVVGGVSGNISRASEAQLGERPEVDYIRAETVFTAQGVVWPSYGRYELSVTWDDAALRVPMKLYVLRSPE